MTMRTIYYWEHGSDGSRFLRSGSARSIAEVARSSGGEVGVILDQGPGIPLYVRAVPIGSSVKATARALAEARRRIGVWL